MSIGKIPTLRRYHNYPHSSARREEWNALPQIPSHDRKEDEKTKTVQMDGLGPMEWNIVALINCNVNGCPDEEELEFFKYIRKRRTWNWIKNCSDSCLFRSGLEWPASHTARGAEAWGTKYFLEYLRIVSFDVGFNVIFNILQAGGAMFFEEVFCATISRHGARFRSNARRNGWSNSQGTHPHCPCPMGALGARPLLDAPSCRDQAGQGWAGRYESQNLATFFLVFGYIGNDFLE